MKIISATWQYLLCKDADAEESIGLLEVLVDCWAGSCVPCLIGVPLLPKLLLTGDAYALLDAGENREGSVIGGLRGVYWKEFGERATNCSCCCCG